MAKKTASRKPAPKAPVAKKAVKKKAAKKPAKKAAGQRLLPGPGELVVRMYRQGLGDCFLLAFGTAKAGDPRYVLVDCGVHSRQVEGTARLARVMEDIHGAVGGRLHVVAATHEHADHLSGFVQKGSPFRGDAFKIDQLWVAWTEKRGDPAADKLREKHGIAREILDAAVKKARAFEGPAPSGKTKKPLTLSERMELAADFDEPSAAAFDARDAQEVAEQIRKMGERRPERAEVRNALAGQGGALGAAAKPKVKPSSNELAIGLLAMLAENQTHAEPGRTLEIPDVEGARAYVLGPPRNEKLLKKDLPSKVRGGHDHEYKETYLSADATMRTFAQSPALIPVDPNTGSILRMDVVQPFAYYVRESVGRPIKELHPGQAKGRAKESSGGEKPEPVAPEVRTFFKNYYFDDKQHWRSIDEEWLAAGEQLALNLDSDTNNTSLVLAFELGEPGEGPVLLFPGDAQVGNWLSWRDQTYNAAGKTMTADDLLGRTLIYKVGHHGSHNATLKCDPRDGSTPDGVAYGLELMDDIIALIPVDRAAADRKMPTPWRMPHRPLYERLREKARRRVLRSDESLKPLEEPAPEDLTPTTTDWSRAPGKPGLEWRRSTERFEDGAPGPLYYEIRMPLGK